MYIDLSKYNRVVDWEAVSKNVEGIFFELVIEAMDRAKSY